VNVLEKFSNESDPLVNGASTDQLAKYGTADHFKGLTVISSESSLAQELGGVAGEGSAILLEVGGSQC